jgi:hypothetical protein
MSANLNNEIAEIKESVRQAYDPAEQAARASFAKIN